jgi:hypothetical protein
VRHKHPRANGGRRVKAEVEGSGKKWAAGIQAHTQPLPRSRNRRRAAGHKPHRQRAGLAPLTMCQAEVAYVIVHGLMSYDGAQNEEPGSNSVQVDCVDGDGFARSRLIAMSNVMSGDCLRSPRFRPSDFSCFQRSADTDLHKGSVKMRYAFERGLYGKLRRPLDWSYIVFFAIHFLASILVDGACHIC